MDKRRQPLRFHEKLDFLMNITATTNVQLSRKTNLDPSYISRLRRGERQPLKDRLVIETMSSHFVRNTILDYQVELLSDMIYPDYKNRDEFGRISLLSDWFCDNGVAIEDGSETFERLKKTEEPCAKEPCAENKTLEDISTQSGSSIYYGIEGKRQAVLRFLVTVMKSKKANPILFFDDGDSAWLLEDGDFKQKVKKGLEAAIEKGHRIIIIHNIKRPLHDMLKAIELWIPVHFTGMTEAYYYPKVRDNLYKRMLCVVPDTVAVVASAIEEKRDNTSNFFVMDPAAVKSFENEFFQLLQYCKPLFETDYSIKRKTFFDLMAEDSGLRGDTIYNLECISVMTMPDEVRNQVMSRLSTGNESFKADHEKQKKFLREKLAEGKYYEIVRKKDLQDISNGRLQYPHSKLNHGRPIYYTKEEYVKHLENFIVLAKEYENFHFVLDKRKKDIDLPLYLKEGRGALLISPKDCYNTLLTKESTLTAAFYDYLKNSTALGNYHDTDKDEQIEEMLAYIEEIKKGIGY